MSQFKPFTLSLVIVSDPRAQRCLPKFYFQRRGGAGGDRAGGLSIEDLFSALPPPPSLPPSVSLGLFSLASLSVSACVLRAACWPPIIRVSRQFRYPILRAGHRIPSFRQQLSWGCTKLLNRSIHSYEVPVTNRFSDPFILGSSSLNMPRPQSTDVIYSNIWGRARAIFVCVQTTGSQGLALALFDPKLTSTTQCFPTSRNKLCLGNTKWSAENLIFGRHPEYSYKYAGNHSFAPYAYIFVLHRKLGLFTEAKLQFDKLVRLSPDWM